MSKWGHLLKRFIRIGNIVWYMSIRRNRTARWTNNTESTDTSINHHEQLLESSDDAISLPVSWLPILEVYTDKLGGAHNNAYNREIRVRVINMHGRGVQYIHITRNVVHISN